MGHTKNKNPIFWLARDKRGYLYLYDRKPIKMDNWGMWTVNSEEGFSSFIDADIFPSIKWEDKEPTKIEIIIKNK